MYRQPRAKTIFLGAQQFFDGRLRAIVTRWHYFHTVQSQYHISSSEAESNHTKCNLVVENHFNKSRAATYNAIKNKYSICGYMTIKE